MTKICRWDTGETIIEGEGSVRDLVEACAKLGNPSLRFARLARANLDGANLAGANLDGASLVGANLYGANLARANLARANLAGANLAGANLAGARLPIWCKWAVTYSPDGTVHIGCKSKSIEQWDKWFAGEESFETSRDSEEFTLIRANYQAMRAYLITRGIVTL